MKWIKWLVNYKSGKSGQRSQGGGSLGARAPPRENVFFKLLEFLNFSLPGHPPSKISGYVPETVIYKYFPFKIFKLKFELHKTG